MKSFKQIALGFALCFVAVLLMAAGFGFDFFGDSKVNTIAMVPPQGVNAGSSSNFCVDVRGLTGTAKIDLVTLTNGACSAATLQIYTSPDRTNWTALANWANATSNSIILTNNNYAGAQLATNIFMIPGTITTPTASTAGYATPYVLPAPFTNTGAITLTTGLQTIGIQIADQTRYIQLFYLFTGASTNTIAATLTARRD